jgi:S1/P1 Nuclease
MGGRGHKTVALIAQHYLKPDVKRKITAMLAADTDPLTKHDFASEATWADKYRDSNQRRDHYEQTEQWHFVVIASLSSPLSKRKPGAVFSSQAKVFIVAPHASPGRPLQYRAGPSVNYLIPVFWIGQA